MAKEEQTWGNCAYAVGTVALSSVMLTMMPSCQKLSEDLFFEVYACENKNIINSGHFPTNYAEMHFMINKYDPQQVAVLCQLKGYGKKTLSEADRKRFMSKFEKRTATCKQCRFHEPRGYALKPKSEMERTKRLDLALKC